MLARTALALLILAATGGGAEAHHAMGGTTPQTLAQGLLSGLAHPVIGLDHLAFTVAAGLLAARLGPPRSLRESEAQARCGQAFRRSPDQERRRRRSAPPTQKFLTVP